MEKAKCCIPLCPKPRNLTCYLFPRNDIKRRQQWLSSINNEDLHISEASLALLDKAGVCSLHFKPDDYVFIFGDDQTSKREINQDAVPSIFPWTSDWFSNYIVEMEIANKLSDTNTKGSDSPTTGLNTSGLPEGEAVEIGNVESLGINTEVSERPQPTVFPQDVKSPNSPKNVGTTRISTTPTCQAKSSSESTSLNSDSSSEENPVNISIKLQPTYNFSCADCNFKTTNPICLKEHRMRIHPPQKSDSVDNKSLLALFKPTTPISQSKQSNSHILKRSVTPCGRTVASYYDKGKRHFYYVCTICDHTTTNTKRLLEHQDKEHPGLPLETSMTSIKNRFATSTPQMSQSPQEQKHSIVSKPIKRETTSNSRVSKTLRKSLTPEAILEELAEKNITKRRTNGRYYYNCPHCSYNTIDRGRILKHYDHHLQNAPSTPESMKPVENKSASQIKNTEGSDGRKQYHCQWCGFSTFSSASLISHEKNHFINAAVKCCVCTYTTSHPKNIRKHMERDHKSDHASKLSHSRSSSSESDIEHLCPQCNFRTFSRKLYAIHEKTHETSGSSTDELISVGDQAEKRKKVGKTNPPLIERSVYHCPTCNYWASHFRTFHEHITRHDNSPAFKCSECEFASRSRRSITRHIQKSIKGSHESASWVPLKPPSEEQYAKYLKLAMVPKEASSGRIQNLDASLSDNIPKIEGETSTSPSALDNSDNSLHEWVPSENSPSSEMDDDDYSSSPSCVMTPKSSSESEDISSSSSFIVSDPKSDDEVKPTNKRNASLSPSPPILTRSSAKENMNNRKRRRIESNEETHGEHDIQPPEISTPSPGTVNQHLESLQTPTGNNKPITLDVVEKQDSSNAVFCDKPTFPAIEGALSKRQEDEKRVAKMQLSLEKMRVRLEAMKKTDETNMIHLNHLKERKESMRARLMKLNSQKIEAELQVRMEQCQELKLSLALYEPEQLSKEPQKALDKCKAKVAELEVKLNCIVQDIDNLQLEQEIVNQQIKELEESRASAGQLMEIMRSEQVEEETELQNFQQELASSDSQFKELVNKERNLIKAQAACWEAELKASYMRTLSKVRQKEREWLNSLDHFVEGKCRFPPLNDEVL